MSVHRPNSVFGLRTWGFADQTQFLHYKCERSQTERERSQTELSICTLNVRVRRPKVSVHRPNVVFTDRTQRLHSEHEGSQTKLSVCRPSLAFGLRTWVFADRTQFLHYERERSQTEPSVRRPNSVFADWTQRSQTKHEYRIFTYSDILYISNTEMWQPSWRSSLSSLMSLHASVHHAYCYDLGCKSNAASCLLRLHYRAQLSPASSFAACSNTLYPPPSTQPHVLTTHPPVLSMREWNVKMVLYLL